MGLVSCYGPALRGMEMRIRGIVSLNSLKEGYIGFRGFRAQCLEFRV